MTAVKTSYQNFMAEMKKATGYTPKQVQAILKREGIESFKAKPRTELRAIVLADYSLSQSIGEQLSTSLPVMEEVQCPLPDCEGLKQPVRRHGTGVGKWRCSVGGARHWIVWRTAVSMNLQFPDKTVGEHMTYLLEHNGTEKK